MTATARPWHAQEPDNWGKVRIYGADENLVAETDDLRKDFPYIENAALIVTAVNNFDALVAMLEKFEWDAAKHWTGDNCVICGAHKSAGSHLGDCELGALLETVRGAS